MKCVTCHYIDYKSQMDRMLKMLTHFHPDMNIEVFNREDINRFGVTDFYYPSLEIHLIDKYSTITHIDADVFIVDRIDELFDDSSDVRAGRNNSDTNKAGKDPGFTLPGLDPMLYVNAGIHSTSGGKFLEDWYKTCMERGHDFPFGEQGVLNYLFHSGNYNSKLLDPVESNIYYGSSTMDGDNSNWWKSWKNFVVVGDHLEYNGKRIKMLHIMGGSCRKPELQSLVTRPVYDFIMSLI